MSKPPRFQPDPPGQSGALERQGKRVPAIFYRTEAGGEPVREWLKGLSREDKKRIGEDVKTVEFGWPVGMPVCRPLGDGIYEVRTSLDQNRIARVLFYVDKEGGWFCYTDSSGKRGRRRPRIWIWREATRASIKGGCHEQKQNAQASGSQRIHLR